MTELEVYKNQTIDNLILPDYLSIGYFTFLDDRLREPTSSNDRLKISINYFKLLSQELSIPFRKLSFFLKDEIAGGINDINGNGHIHFLLSFFGLEKLITEYNFHNEITDYFRITNTIIKKLKMISRAKGISKVSRYNYLKHGRSGINYTAKVSKRKWNEKKNCFNDDIIFSGIDYYSRGLEKEIDYRKQNNIFSTNLIELNNLAFEF